MTIEVTKTTLQEIMYLRNLFLQENNFQIRYNACHERGWTDSYAVMCNQEKIGYGAVKGNENIRDRDTVFEFYIIPSFRNLVSIAFQQLLRTSQAKFIESQTNNLLLTSLLYEHGKNIRSDVICLKKDLLLTLKLIRLFSENAMKMMWSLSIKQSLSVIMF